MGHGANCGNGAAGAAPLMVTVSGCRGIVGASLTPETVCRFVGAFAATVHDADDGDGPAPVVVLGRDGRAGGDVIAQVAVGALRAAGCNVIDLDVATTPTVGLMVRRHAAAGGLVVTASHNPAQWNGMKALTCEGRAPDAESAARLVERFHAGATALVGHEGLGAHERDDTAAHAHVAAVLEAIGRVTPVEGIRKPRFKVALDSVNASGRIGGRLLLEALGCEFHHVGNDCSGVFPHAPEPTEENLRSLCGVTRAAGAAAGFAQDPDADRLALVDEHGRYVGEEYTLALAAESALAAGALGDGASLAANLSTSRMIDDVAERHGARVVRSAVGEANVAEAMDDAGCSLGGEGNGGVIWRDVVMIRDSLSGMALVLALMARTGKPLSALVDALPKYAIVKRKVEIREGLAAKAIAALRDQHSGPGARLDEQDGIRIDWANDRAWLHVRASNTEPILRLIAEAPSLGRAEAVLDDAQRVVAGL